MQYLLSKFMSSYQDRFEEEVNRIGITAISDHLGVVRNTIYNWMGKANVPLNYLVALQAFGMDVVYVIFGARSKDSLSPDENELIDLFRAAPLVVKASAIGGLRGGTVPPPAKIKKQTNISVGTNHGQTAEKIVNKKP